MKAGHFASALVVAALANLASARADEFVYDGAHRLVRTRKTDLVETFRYDPAGSLAQHCVRVREESARCQRVLINLQGEHPTVIAVSEGPTAGLTYARGPLGPELISGAGGTRALLRDNLGSIRGEASLDGTLRARRAYDTFGSPRAVTGQFINQLGFAGEVQSTGGLVYLRARHYDPTWGRLPQRDSFAGTPLRPTGLNRYAYAAGNPVKATDPSGLSPWYDNDVVSYLQELAKVTIGFGDVVTDGITFGQLSSRRIRGWLGNDVAGLESAEAYGRGSAVGTGVNLGLAVYGGIGLVRSAPRALSYLTGTSVSQGARDLLSLVQAMPSRLGSVPELLRADLAASGPDSSVTRLLARTPSAPGTGSGTGADSLAGLSSEVREQLARFPPAFQDAYLRRLRQQGALAARGAPAELGDAIATVRNLDPAARVEAFDGLRLGIESRYSGWRAERIELPDGTIFAGTNQTPRPALMFTRTGRILRGQYTDGAFVTGKDITDAH